MLKKILFWLAIAALAFIMISYGFVAWVMPVVMAFYIWMAKWSMITAAILIVLVVLWIFWKLRKR